MTSPTPAQPTTATNHDRGVRRSHTGSAISGICAGATRAIITWLLEHLTGGH